ncbi:MAG TPA: hypothetical protein VLA66_09205 [Thermoanaerobaculia bacterium]|nr:hypothetical protein [Thermoanaerobaculia bacterium]
MKPLRLLILAALAALPGGAAGADVTHPGVPQPWHYWSTAEMFITTVPSEPDVALFEDGRFAVVWAQPVEGISGIRQIRARSFAEAGNALTGAVDLMPVPISGDGHRPKIVAAPDRGSVYVAFLRGDKSYTIEERAFPSLALLSSVSGSFSSGLEATDLDLARHPGYGVVMVAQVELYTGLERVLRLRYQHDLTPLDGAGVPVVDPLELSGVTVTMTETGRVVIGWAHADATHTRIDGVQHAFGNPAAQQPLPNIASMPFDQGTMHRPIFAPTPEADDLGLMIGLRHSLPGDSVGIYARSCGWATCKGFRHLVPEGSHGYDLDTDARGFAVAVFTDSYGFDVQTLERFGDDYLPADPAAPMLLGNGYPLPVGYGPAVDVRSNGDFAIVFHYPNSGGLHVRRFRSAARLFYDGFESGSTGTWSSTVGGQ